MQSFASWGCNCCLRSRQAGKSYLEAGKRRSSSMGSRKAALATACCAALLLGLLTEGNLLQDRCKGNIQPGHESITWTRASADPAAWAAGRQRWRLRAVLPAGVPRVGRAAADASADATACPLLRACLQTEMNDACPRCSELVWRSVNSRVCKGSEQGCLVHIQQQQLYHGLPQRALCSVLACVAGSPPRCPEEA